MPGSPLTRLGPLSLSWAVCLYVAQVRLGAPGSGHSAHALQCWLPLTLACVPLAEGLSLPLPVAGVGAAAEGARALARPRGTQGHTRRKCPG